MRLTGVIDYSMGNFLCIRGFCPMIKLATRKWDLLLLMKIMRNIL